MKKTWYFLLSVLSICSVTFLNLKAQVLEDCSDLFISEIIFENPIYDNSGLQTANMLTAVDHNNVIELYNPTQDTIDLAEYAIVLTPENNGTPVTQTLSGSINPKQTALVSNFNSNTSITSVAQVVSSLIEFQGKVQIELVKNSTDVKDRIGQTGVSQAVLLDLDELLNNPVYLNGEQIDLTSIQNFGIRRNPNVKKGNLTFDPDALLGEWGVFPNTALDNLGQYTCVCSGPIILFSYEQDQVILSAYENQYDILSVNIHYLNPLYNSIDWGSFSFDYRVVINHNTSSATNILDYTLENGAENWMNYPYSQQVIGVNSDNEKLSWSPINIVDDGIAENDESIYFTLEVGNVQGIPNGYQISVLHNVGNFTIKDGHNIGVIEKLSIKNLPSIYQSSDINLNSIPFSKAELYNTFGQNIISTQTSIIPTSQLNTGIYFLKIYHKQQISAKKILIYND